MPQSDVIIIVPVFNEAAQISKVIHGIRAKFDADVLVVNDCSHDESATLAGEAGALVVTHSINLRYGASVQTGILYACTHGYSYLAQMDGDGQHDTAYLDAILQPIRSGEADYVIGSRFLHQDGVESYNGAWIRTFGSRVISLLIFLVTGMKVTDPTSGFIAMNRAVMEVLASDVYPEDFPDADVIIFLHRRNFQVKEVPVRMLPSIGKSIHSGIIRPFYYAYKMSLSILMTLLRK